MANYLDRYEDNISGPYFVDSSCIACDTCVGIAPKHFTLNALNDHAFICLQPKNQDEDDLCRKALTSCPVQAIGKQE
jgi:ferredoxin